MPLPTITDCYRCSILGQIGDDVADNVIHVTNPGGAGALADVASDVGAAWVLMIQTTNQFSAQYQANQLDVLPLDGVSATVSFVPASWPVAGETANQPVPSNVARIITLQTGIGGRSNRGRIFLAGEDNGDMLATSTAWEPTKTVDMFGAAEAFFSALNPGPGGSQLVVASYKLASARPVTSVVARPYLGTQRRRAQP